MRISADIDRRDLDRLQTAMDRAAEELGRDMRSLVKQASIWAIQSAARETAPSRASSPSRLPVRYRYRPISRYRGSVFIYAQNDKIVFKTERRLSKKSETRRGVRRVRRQIEIWSRKSHSLISLPYLGSATGRYDRQSRIGRIPHAGAAKAGWLRALGLLPGSAPRVNTGELDPYTPSPRVRVAARLSSYSIFIENTVRYIAQTSPNAARAAMSSTANRMTAMVNRLIERRNNSRVEH